MRCCMVHNIGMVRGKDMVHTLAVPDRHGADENGKRKLWKGSFQLLLDLIGIVLIHIKK